MKKIIYILLYIFLVACGKDRHWPAEISACENCTTEESGVIAASLVELNQKSGGTLMSVPENLEASPKNTETAAFTIKISFVDAAVIQEGDNSTNTRAGLATVYEDRCEVQLSKDLHKEENAQYFKAVLWHEMGHCAGLAHDDSEENLMFAVTKKFQAYSEEAMAKFISKFKESAHL